MLTKEEMYRIILEIDDNWKVREVTVNDAEQEVIVQIGYVNEKAIDPESGEWCSLYDHREQRRWRHLDTMQYKTYLSCHVPRVMNKQGKVNTIAVPWADRLERFTYLLEKKSD